MAEIAEYNCVFHHLLGKRNKVADALSRNVIAAADIGIDFRRLQQLQQQEKDYAKRLPSLILEEIQSEKGDLLCDVSTTTPRPWIPEPMRKELFQTVHGLSHPSR